MKLIDCYIENFGKLSDFKLSFSDGLNTVKKDNGYGKTTLSVFIKAMLYGLDDTKRMKLEENDRKHYMPWQGGRCGGSLTFEANERKYRIERTFMPKAAEDSFTLYDVKSGKVCKDFSKNVGEELFGIDADGFERTVFLSEANLSGKNENKTVSAKLSNLVGCDGDLSAMDDALLLLEKERKLYYKRGGGGEIGDVKAKKIDLERRISDLERLGAAYKEEEAKLKEIISELNLAYAEKKRITNEARRADEARLRKTYEKQYANMKASVDSDERALTALKLFFVRGIPTADETERAKEMHREARRIYSLGEKEKDPEFSAISDFFKCGVPESEYKRAKETAEAIRTKENEAEIIERTICAADIPKKNGGFRPDIADSFIEKLSSHKLTRNVNKTSHITIPAGIILSLLGIALGIVITPLLFFSSAIGLIILILGMKNKSDARKSKAYNEIYDAACEFIEAEGYEKPSDVKELVGMLYEAKNRLKAEEAKRHETMQSREKLNALREEIALLTRDACEFISKFPKTDAPTVTDSIAEILRRRDVYIALSEREGALIRRKEEELSLAAKYKGCAEEFLSRFPTVTDNPFEEIRGKLVEYATLSRSIERMRESLEAFRKEHGIDPDISFTEASAESEFLYDPSAIEAKISELERNKALAERQCKAISDELDLADELHAELDILTEKEKIYTEKLDVILKTEKYLSEAKDSLTSKYLSKTKEAFDRYVGIIAKESGDDFHMDTSFSLKKNEKGTLRGTEAYSRGTRDMYALAARFALIDSLYENESPFVILDDPFAYFDDAKLTRAASALSAIAKEKQIIYLTCSSARKI